MADTLFNDLMFRPEFPENEEKDGRDIKKSIKLKQTATATTVYALAVDPRQASNRLVEIPCGSGEPISPVVRDYVRDVCHVSCVAYHEVGDIPVSYRLAVEDWEQAVPLPAAVIRRYMTADQRRLLDKFKLWHAGRDIRYLQLLRTY